jgi:hypothetical protein
MAILNLAETSRFTSHSQNDPPAIFSLVDRGDLFADPMPAPFSTMPAMTSDR